MLFLKSLKVGGAGSQKEKVNTKQERLRTNWNLCLSPTASRFFAAKMYLCLVQDSENRRRKSMGAEGAWILPLPHGKG